MQSRLYNPIAGTPITANLVQNSVSELVNVPKDLAYFASEPLFHATLLKIKEQSGISSIYVKRNPDTQLAESVLIDSLTQESGVMARKLVELHFKAQLKIMISESKLKNVQKDLYTVQGDMASGSHIEFFVKPDLMGLVIGKKGVRIQSVEKINGIKSVNIDGSTGKISITGPDSSTVQSAREFLELFEESFDIQPIHAEWLSKDRTNGSLTDIKTAADLMVAKVDREKNQLIVIGTGPAVRSARTFLATQLEYINKQIGIESTMQSTREQLFSFKKQYGLEYGRSGRGGRGGRGDDRRGDDKRGDDRRGDDRRGDDRRGDDRRGDDRRGDGRNDGRREPSGPSSLTSLPQPASKSNDERRNMPPRIPTQQSKDSRSNNNNNNNNNNKAVRDTLQDINTISSLLGNMNVSGDVRQQDKDKAAAKSSTVQQDSNNGKQQEEKAESRRKRSADGKKGKGDKSKAKDEKEVKSSNNNNSASQGTPKSGDEVAALIKGTSSASNSAPVRPEESTASLPKRVRKPKPSSSAPDTAATTTTTSPAPAPASAPLVKNEDSSVPKASYSKGDTSAKGLSIRDAQKKKEANKTTSTEGVSK